MSMQEGWSQTFLNPIEANFLSVSYLQSGQEKIERQDSCC